MNKRLFSYVSWHAGLPGSPAPVRGATLCRLAVTQAQWGCLHEH